MPATCLIDASKLLGYRKRLSAVRVSPDARRVVVAGGAASASVYDIDGTLLFELDHYGSVTDAAFSPDGAILATASSDMGIRLWSEGSLMRLLKGHVHQVASIAWSAAGMLASASFDGSLRIWSPEQETWCARGLGILRALTWTREGLAVAGDRGVRLYDEKRALVAYDEVSASSLVTHGAWLAALTRDSAIVFDARTLERCWETRAGAFCFGPDGRAAVADGAAIRICDVATGNVIFVLEGHDGPVRALAFRAGVWLSGGDDAVARVWSASGMLLGEIHHPHVVIAFTGMGDQALTIARDGSIRSFEPAEAPAPKPVRPAPAPVLRIDAESSSDSAVFSPDGSKIAIAAAGGVSVFDAESGRCVSRLECGEATWGVQWTDRLLMARLQKSTSWRIWDATTLELRATLPGKASHAVSAGDVVIGWDGNHVVAMHVPSRRVLLDRESKQWIDACQFSPSGTHAVILSRDLPPDVIDLAAGRLVTLGNLAAQHAAFGPDGELVAAGTNESVALWHAGTGTLVRDIEMEGPPWSMVWRGDRIALAMRDGRVRLFDGALESVAVLEGEQERRGELGCPLFSPDGELFAVQGQRCAAQLARARDGSIVAHFSGHASDFVKAIFASDDRLVSYSHVTPTDDFVLRLWDREGVLLDVLAGQAGRHFWSVVAAGSWVTSVVWGDRPRVWNTRDGRAFGALEGHRAQVRSARYASDASRLVTLDDTGLALVWDLTPSP